MSARVLLVGAGGHARVCLEALQDDSANDVVGAVSTDGRGLGDLGVGMLGADGDIVRLIEQHQLTAAFAAIGDNAARSRAVQRCLDAGLTVIAAVSRFAMVSRTAVIGAGAALLPGAVVNAATHVGTGAIVNTNASVDHDGRIGDFVHVAPGVAIGGAVTVGAFAMIGTGARILPGVTIGRDAIIGAGAVVRHDVADGETVVGVPARPLLRTRR
ncbi:MAG: acetyltransferase [Ilumatobacteraceae bacterium]